MRRKKQNFRTERTENRKLKIFVDKAGKVYSATIFSIQDDNIIIEFEGDFHQFHRARMKLLMPYEAVIKYELLSPVQE